MKSPQELQSELFLICQGGDVAGALDLLQMGASVNCVDEWEMTPLMYTCAYGQKAMAKLLIEHGADIARRDKLGRNARDMAIEVGEIEIAGLIESVKERNFSADADRYFSKYPLPEKENRQCRLANGTYAYPLSFFPFNSSERNELAIKPQSRQPTISETDASTLTGELKAIVSEHDERMARREYKGKQPACNPKRERTRESLVDAFDRRASETRKIWSDGVWL